MIIQAASVAAQVSLAGRSKPVKPSTGLSESVRIEDIDEATWYILKGAQMVGIKIKKVAENRIRKVGHSQHWSVFLIHINARAMATWKSGKAAYPIKDFMTARRHLKNRIKNYRD